MRTLLPTANPSHCVSTEEEKDPFKAKEGLQHMTLCLEKGVAVVAFSQTGKGFDNFLLENCQKQNIFYNMK